MLRHLPTTNGYQGEDNQPSLRTLIQASQAHLQVHGTVSKPQKGKEEGIIVQVQARMTGKTIIRTIEDTMRQVLTKEDVEVQTTLITVNTAEVAVQIDTAWETNRYQVEVEEELREQEVVEEIQVILVTNQEEVDIQMTETKIEETRKIKTNGHKGTDQAPTAVMYPSIDNTEYLEIG